MKKLIALLLCISLLLCAAAATAEGTAITVKGTSTVSAAPDQFSLSASVNFTAPTVVEAQTGLSDVIADVTDALNAIGLYREEVVTSNYSCYPSYDYSGETSKLIGYQANHTLSITCHDVDKINDVITALSNHGITDIYSINYDITDKTMLYTDALTGAVAAARAKAQILAAAMGLSTLEIVSVTENAVNAVGYTVRAASVSNSAEDTAISTGINSGDVSVSAAVEMVFCAK